VSSDKERQKVTKERLASPSVQPRDLEANVLLSNTELWERLYLPIDLAAYVK
jgi:hypothetical protein